MSRFQGVCLFSTVFFCWHLCKKIVCCISQTQYNLFPPFLLKAVCRRVSVIFQLSLLDFHLENPAGCQQRGMRILDGPGTKKPFYCLQRAAVFGSVLSLLYCSMIICYVCLLCFNFLLGKEKSQEIRSERYRVVRSRGPGRRGGKDFGFWVRDVTRVFSEGVTWSVWTFEGSFMLLY